MLWREQVAADVIEVLNCWQGDFPNLKPDDIRAIAADIAECIPTPDKAEIERLRADAEKTITGMADDRRDLLGQIERLRDDLARVQGGADHQITGGAFQRTAPDEQTI